MFALHKYNMYRELLFVGFIALLVLYCTGLMRDLRRGGADGDESDDSDLEEVGLPVEEADEDDDEQEIVVSDTPHAASVVTCRGCVLRPLLVLLDAARQNPANGASTVNTA